MLAIYRIQTILTDKSSSSVILTLPVLTHLCETRCQISSLLSKRQRTSWVCNRDKEQFWIYWGTAVPFETFFFFVTFCRHWCYSHSNGGLRFHCAPEKEGCRATQEVRCSKLYMGLLLTTVAWLSASATFATALPVWLFVVHQGYAKYALSSFNSTPFSMPYFDSTLASHSVHQVGLSLFHILL